MSDIGLGFDPHEDEHATSHRREQPSAPGRRADRGSHHAGTASRRGRGCLPVLIILAIIAAGIWFGGGAVIDKVQSLVGVSADYPGPGTGSVTVEVHEGDSSAAIGRTLKEAGVVKSVSAFTDAAIADERSRSIQVGYYALKKEMKAEDALAVLVDPKNLIQARVTIPEGSRVKDVVKAITKNTDIPARQVRAALNDPGSLGLPPAAGGQVEGYLFPATYSVVPGQTAKQLLRQMVAKSKQVMSELDVAAKARGLGYTPQEIMTIASILEYEGSRGEDYPKIAQAIYNRLDDGMALQSDATVAYANNLSGTVYTTQAEREKDSPYNTYKYTGLPPGPIGSPGEATIKAALNPEPGPWLYWVVVNLRTGETRFNESYSDHLADVEVFREYCKTSDAC